MLDLDLSFEDMRLIVDIRDVLSGFGDAAPSLTRLKTELQARKHKLGNGMGRELDDLEQKLGGVRSKGKLLLERRKTGALMRPKGYEIAAKCERILRSFDELITLATDGRQTLRFGVTNAVTTNMLPRVFQDPEFLAALPNTDFEIIDGESWELVTTLFTSVEFAIGSRVGGVPSDCVVESLCWRKRVLLFNPLVKYKHDYTQPVSSECLRDWLRDETLILPDLRVIPELKTFLHPMTTGRKVSVMNAAARRTWVERGSGLAISHEEIMATLNNSDRIRTIDLSDVLGETELVFYFHKNRPLSHAATVVVKLLKSMFAEPPAYVIGGSDSHGGEPRSAERTRSW